MRSRHLLFLFGFVILALFVSTAVAQNNFPGGNQFKINGVPPSVTSFGFGGHPGRCTGAPTMSRMPIRCT